MNTKKAPAVSAVSAKSVKPGGTCNICKTEVASGPNAAGVADAVERHKKKAHGKSNWPLDPRRSA